MNAVRKESLCRHMNVVNDRLALKEQASSMERDESGRLFLLNLVLAHFLKLLVGCGQNDLRNSPTPLGIASFSERCLRQIVACGNREFQLCR